MDSLTSRQNDLIGRLRAECVRLTEALELQSGTSSERIELLSAQLSAAQERAERARAQAQALADTCSQCTRVNEQLRSRLQTAERHIDERQTLENERDRDSQTAQTGVRLIFTATLFSIHAEYMFLPFKSPTASLDTTHQI